MSAVQEASSALEMAKLSLREQQASQPASADDLGGRMVKIKDLDDVLIKDVGGVIASTNKWPLVVDVSSRASTFLR